MDSCEMYHMDYLCENLQLTTDIQERTCAVAVYMDTTETNSYTPTQLTCIIQTKCDITYHEVLYPASTTLQTQDEILLANFRTDTWHLYCPGITDRPHRFAIATPQGCFLYESARTCTKPDADVTLYYTYNRPLVSYDTSIDRKTTKCYSKRPYPFRALDLTYHCHDPYLTTNGSLKMHLKRHAPEDEAFQHALESQTFPLEEAVRKMESQEPTYIGTFFPICQSLVIEDTFTMETDEDFSASHQPSSSSDSASLLEPVNTTVANFAFNIVTLINALVHCCLLISLKLSFRQGGWFNNMVIQMVQAALTKKSVEAVKLLSPNSAPTQHLLYLPIEWDIPPTEAPSPSETQAPTLFSQAHIAAFVSILKTFSILVALLLLPIFFWMIFRYVITPLFHRSNICRQLFVGCFYNPTFRRPPTTDLFLDIIHIHSGQQIRIFLTTISAAACALSFTGTVLLCNFKVVIQKLQLLVHIDWHYCLLLYNNFVIPLPETGSAFPFQPNLLTDFQCKGPHNIVLLARHLDHLIQIPHLEQVDNLSSVESLDFPLLSPYKKIHDEVKALMPLA